MGLLDFLFGKTNDADQQEQYCFDENGFYTFPNGIKVAHVSSTMPSIEAVLEKSGYKDKLEYHINNIGDLSSAKKFDAFCGVYQLFTDKPLLLILGRPFYPSEKQVEKILKDGKSLHRLSTWEVESILEKCINAKSVCLKDIEDLNAIRISNNKYNIGDYQFVFENGIFCGFNPIDGFNKYVKDTFVKYGSFDLYLRHASDYWGVNHENIVKEVNYQAECFSKIGNGVLSDEYYNNKFRFPDGLIDYVSMALCYSSSDVEFDKFEIALHGDFRVLRKLIDEDGKEVIEVSLPQYNEKCLFIDGHSKSKEEIEAEDAIWDDITNKIISGEIDVRDLLEDM